MASRTSSAEGADRPYPSSDFKKTDEKSVNTWSFRGTLKQHVVKHLLNSSRVKPPTCCPSLCVAFFKVLCFALRRLMADRTMLEETLRNRGVRLIRTISGHIQALSPRHTSQRVSSSSSQPGSPSSAYGGSPTEVPLVRGPSSVPPNRE